MSPEPPRRPELPRAGRDRGPMRVPMRLADSGLVVIDATWGTIRPMQLVVGVRTVGELEVMEHLDRGLSLIDSRPAEAYGSSTIPGARNIPHAEAMERISQLDPAQPTIFFCNGPQCAASPESIDALLTAKYPPAAIRYYRGGLHDWISLGLPTEPPPPPA
jgi:rhodanese-related sulfurtransferase